MIQGTRAQRRKDPSARVENALEVAKLLSEPPCCSPLFARNSTAAQGNRVQHKLLQRPPFPVRYDVVATLDNLLLDFYSFKPSARLYFTMISRPVLLSALFLQGLALSTLALDVEVTDYECDQSLYITADFEVKCDGSKRCTFGKSIAHVSGTRKCCYSAECELNVFINFSLSACSCNFCSCSCSLLQQSVQHWAGK